MSKLGDLFPQELQPQSKAKPSAPKNDARSAAGSAGSAGSAVGAGEFAAHIFIKDLIPGQEIEGVFLVVEATLRAAKNGSKYVQASLSDKTGAIPARQWDANEKDFAPYKASCYVKVRGRVETYKNMAQMIVFAAQECAAASVSAADFMPVSARPQEEMAGEFEALLESFSDPDYKNLLRAIFADAEVRERFFKSPAAMAIHHAWSGGLLEHVLSAAQAAQAIAAQRPFLNRDLLLAGVLLHDIGKIEELDAGPGFSYTDTGRLCGHIALGTLLVERFISKLPDFPKRKRDLILHMILSHHGELEYGSPVTPATAEAVALHHLECLDAKVQGIQTLIEKDRLLGNEGAWTEYARVVDGRIFKG